MIEKVDRTYEWDCQYQSLRLILNKNYKGSKGAFSTTQFPFRGSRKNKFTLLMARSSSSNLVV